MEPRFYLISTFGLPTLSLLFQLGLIQAHKRFVEDGPNSGSICGCNSYFKGLSRARAICRVPRPRGSQEE